MFEHKPSPAPSPIIGRNGRDGTKKGISSGVNIRDTIRFEVESVMSDDKQVNDKRNRLTKRHIIGLSVALALFGVLCVAVGVAIVYLNHWIQFDSGMSKYACFKESVTSTKIFKCCYLDP